MEQAHRRLQHLVGMLNGKRERTNLKHQILAIPFNLGVSNLSSARMDSTMRPTYLCSGLMAREVHHVDYVIPLAYSLPSRPFGQADGL